MYAATISMEAFPFVNGWQTLLRQEAMSILLRILHPIAPHITHRLWIDLGFGKDILQEQIPTTDDSALVKDSIELVVQINGKVRNRLEIAADTPADELEQLARNDERILELTKGKSIVKCISVPGKLVNLVHDHLSRRHDLWSIRHP